MAKRAYVYLFQAIKVPYKDEPLRVIEQRFLPASECTLDAAKAMLMMRFEDRSYPRQHGALWPDAVRFLDEQGQEILRYSCWNYLREVTSREEAWEQARTSTPTTLSVPHENHELEQGQRSGSLELVG
jgi:hypothetical protein